jgi:dTDP-4-amino-4,6-dideoxygalactose transaminase
MTPMATGRTTRQPKRIPLYNVFLPVGTEKAISGVLASGQIASGPCVAEFERLFGDYINNPLVTSTGDVSSSLTLSLFLAGVRPGDDVLMSPLVCLSTSSPVRNLFANIRWCDVDPLTGNIDPSRLEDRITKRTKAVVVFHWGGTPADLDAIRAVAAARRLSVIEDAGEALGAEYHGRKIGATGSDFAVFSFYPNRHLTTLEGGAVACVRPDDWSRLRWLKRYGIHQPTFRDEEGEINPKSNIAVSGWNSYMSNLAAAVGIEQMKQLAGRVAVHRANGQFYNRVLAGIAGVRTLKNLPGSSSAYWVYTFLARKRDRLLKHLRLNGIQASRVHVRNDVYTCFGGVREPFPGVEEFSAECLSIPCGWWVTEDDRARIVELIRNGEWAS